MTYDVGKLNLQSQPLSGPKQWHYEDTGGESAATYAGAGWFTDAKDRGVDTGDLLQIFDRKNSAVYNGYFSVIQDTGNTQGTAVLDTGTGLGGA